MSESRTLMPKSSFWRPRPLGVNHLPNPLRKIPPATTPALASDKILHYYAYDFIANPWLGGGGAYRDLEILSRFRPCFQGIRCYVGYYPGAKRTSVRGIDVIPLGFGSNEILSRITYVLASNWRILFHGNSPLGVALSIYSPLWTAVLHRKSLFAVLHHVIGRHWMCKLGRAGWLIYALESLYRRLPSYFVVVNGEVADGIRKTLPRAQVYLTSNAFDPALLEVVDTSHASPPFLLFIGRIDVFMKGLDLLIEAFAALASKYPELSLVIAGKGDQASEAALLALARQYGLEHRISLRKNVSDQEKQELLSACLLVCSPSRFEGFGIAVLEASAAGKPVVVSQASGFAHSVRQGYSGIRVDIAEKQNLPQALMGLLEDPEKRIRMGRQARDWALRFTWDSIAKREAQWLGSHLGWGG